jgi:hypothetical protein
VQPQATERTDLPNGIGGSSAHIAVSGGFAGFFALGSICMQFIDLFFNNSIAHWENILMLWIHPSIMHTI